MFRWGVVFLIIALISAALGLGGLASAASWTAKIVCLIGIVLFFVSLFAGCKR